VVARCRMPTKPTRGSQARRLDSKHRHGRIKAMRGRIED
jgi:ribosome-associated protein